MLLLSIMIDDNREQPAGQSDPPAAAGSRPGRHQVRDTLQRWILGGQLKGGQRLRQIELAKQFGVSQSVVRESLLELRFCGLVDAVEHVGVFVREFDPQTLLSAYEIREVFEGLAARRCCEHASRRDLRELRDMAERIYALAQQGQHEAMGALDRQWHQRTIAISGNPVLERLTEGYRVLGMVVRAHRDFDQVRREHLAILDAIEAGDATLAERLAREHVQAARAAVEAQVQCGDFTPAWVRFDDEPTPGDDAT